MGSHLDGADVSEYRTCWRSIQKKQGVFGKPGHKTHIAKGRNKLIRDSGATVCRRAYRTQHWRAVRHKVSQCREALTECPIALAQVLAPGYKHGSQRRHQG